MLLTLRHTVNYCSVSRPVWTSDSFYHPLNRHQVITESHLQHRSIDRALTAFYLRAVKTQWIQTSSDYISSVGDKLLNHWMLSNWRNSNPDPVSSGPVYWFYHLVRNRKSSCAILDSPAKGTQHLQLNLNIKKLNA